MAEQNKNSTSTPPRPRGHGPMGRGMAEKPKNFKKSFGMLMHMLKPYRWLILIACLAAAIGTVLYILGPNVTKKMGEEILNHYVIIDGKQVGINYRHIAEIGIWLILLYAASSLLNLCQSYIMASITAKLTKNLRNKISEKINKLPLKYFDGTSTGDILSRVTNDLDTLANSLNESVSSIISSIGLIIGAIILMFVNSWQLALITLASTPVSLIFTVIVVKISQKYFIRQQKYLGEINGEIEEVYSAHNVVRVFNSENEHLKTFDIINNNLSTANFKANYLGGIMHPIMTVTSNIMYALICVIGGIMSINNPIFLATVVTFFTYSRYFNDNITQIASVSTTIQTTVAAAERIFEILDEKEESDESKKPYFDQVFKGEVDFENVSFGYVKDKEIIHNFNQHVSAGQKVAIVGPTGAGKTTLVNLLMRFYEVNSGSIKIDGINIQDMTRAQLRSLFGMVLQDTWLFEGTIKENLTFGNVGATNEEIERACVAANVDHIIKSMPGSYDYVIKDESFSAGEKQLLTIARAMIENAPMLILDEATSSVDTRTEEMIQKAMDELTAGRTSFIIAHRLSTIKNADLILVMKDGDIIEQGTHKELMKLHGFYSELYNSQFTKNAPVEEIA